ncbi:MAG: MFS transporter [Candidatus Poribacteria bacterium]|nr:MFS transporter [Candidatus Poribacteria bacterium]
MKKVGHFKHLALFVIAYMIYNDGIHTVTSMATIYGKEELGLGTPHLMVTLLLVQVVAIGGALIFSLIANRIGARRAVMVSLVLWSGVVIYGYFIQTATEFFILGMVVGIVLGGTQALSRSFYGAMIPEQASAEFYGFYSVFSKFSAIWGPTTFGVIKQITGSARLAIISLMVFFIVGLILLAFVNEEKAKTEKLAFDLEDDN